ncbi:unnamed protein product [marine sediment metagenome]|uniref:Uncharacterized protein n=1 Tax=marine sediment metagenome TaxID=412755 RepID=X0RRZ1_9ZZZZ
MNEIISHDIEETPEGLYRGTIRFRSDTTVEIVKPTAEEAWAWCREFEEKYGKTSTELW